MTWEEENNQKEGDRGQDKIMSVFMVCENMIQVHYIHV
jgi:hypothetical protein